MKMILCDNSTCIHYEESSLGNGFTVMTCARCDDLVVNTSHDRCDGYEHMDDYFSRLKNDITEDK